MSDVVQLSRVAVVGLFGLFDHSVDLRTLDRVTILHGPNGVGKTVILRMIHAFFDGKYEALLDTNFQELFVELTDGRSLKVRRLLSKGGLDESMRSVEIESGSASDDTYHWFKDHAEYRRTAEFIDAEVHTITRVSEELWTDDITGETYSPLQLVRKFYDVLPDKLKAALTKDPSWLIRFREALSVHLVETQRLLLAYRESDPRRFRPRTRPLPRGAFASTVKTYSSHLRERMATALTTYGEHSEVLDRSFPQRMLGGPRPEVLDTISLKDRMNKLEIRRAQLRKIGLIDDDASYPFDINTLDAATDMQKAVMTLYVEDTENKLSVLDDLKEKVDLLLGNINRKFSPNKHLGTDRGAGLTVRDNKNVRIDLDSLSSGEQHELVLIYDLLFQVKTHSLVLIDEPELSLHVTWQKAFLKELFAIINSVDFDVLLATHSPFIVGDRIDLMVPLALDTPAPDIVIMAMEEQPSLA